MRVRLRGINSITKKLATGERVTYHYAWKGGPRLEGKPGSPEFVASYNAAVAAKIKAPEKHLRSIIQAFEQSGEFTRLAPRTQIDYGKHIKKIELRFGDFPISGLADRRSRGIFKGWRDELAKQSLRQADYAWTVLARILSWAKERGIIDVNPCAMGGRLYRNSRVDSIWMDDDEARFMAVASPPLRLAMLLAIWTGQRQGDLLRLPWAAYDGKEIRLKQGKTGVRVRIPVSDTLKAALDEVAKAKKSPVILINQDGRPWTENGFRSSWGKACDKAGIDGLTFHDLRGTAVTRLFMAGCSEAEIAVFTGHSLNDVRAILDAHYFHRDHALAESAVRKLEKRTKSPN